jgi:hypothetical protein
MSWHIFVHSVRQVFGNLEGALRVSALLTILQIIVTLTLGRFLMMDAASLQMQMTEGNFDWPSYAMTMVLLVLIGLWIAVSWHRYVLLNEAPGWLPRLHLDRVMGYFGKSVLIGLLILPVALILTMIVGIIAASMLGGGQVAPGFLMGAIIGLLVYVPVGTLLMRLSTALPGVALEPGVSVFAGWRATEGHTLTIMGVVLSGVIGGLVLGLPNLVLFEPGSIPALVWQFASQWVIVMVGASILTTLYGHYVEGRPLV